MEMARARLHPRRLNGLTNTPPFYSYKAMHHHVVVGAISGLTAGLVLGGVMIVDGADTPALLPAGSSAVLILAHFAAAVAIGAGFGRVFRYQPRGYAALISSGLMVGLLWWIVGPLTLVPLLRGNLPTWSLEEATAVFPNLIAALLYGSLTGLFYYLLVPAVKRRWPPPQPSAAFAQPATPTHVVVLGGGFGGVAVAQRLEQLHVGDPSPQITLVSQSNYLLFTPMLAEVAGSSLEAQHISAPVRASCPHTRFYRGQVTHIDLEAQVVYIAEAPTSSLHYDHLVLALGSVPHYRDLPGMEEYSFSLKSLQDATSLRNHVIGLLERADVEADPDKRRRQLTFVVAGGGFAGTEMIAELFDLVHSALRYYPNVPTDELRFVLVHSRDRILPEIGSELAEYALGKLRDRGIEFLLETRVAGATPEAILLGDGTTVQTRTVVWTAGSQPNPLLASLPCERSRTGALLADSTLRITGHENLWAVGDCAQIPDPDKEGTYYPPTAQHALREGKAVAENIAAVERGDSLKPFRFKTIGVLVGLGHRTAVAEIRGRRFSGLLAWLLWRGVYLSKLPGLEKKVRVLFDWTIDLFFPRDIVLTAEPTPTLPQTLAAEEAVHEQV